MRESTFSDDDRLETVYTVTNPLQAELVKDLLLHHAIPCQLDGDHQAGLTGVLTIGVLVRASDATEALEIIAAHHVEANDNDETSEEDDAEGSSDAHSYTVQGGLYEREDSINAFRLDH